MCRNVGTFSVRPRHDSAVACVRRLCERLLELNIFVFFCRGSTSTTRTCGEHFCKTDSTKSMPSSLTHHRTLRQHKDKMFALTSTAPTLTAAPRASARVGGGRRATSTVVAAAAGPTTSSKIAMGVERVKRVAASGVLAVALVRERAQ